MSWDTDLYSALKANTAFNDAITSLAYEYKADAAAPFATYQLIGAPGSSDLDGHTAEGYRTIQVNIAAASPTQAKEIAQNAIIGAKAGLIVVDVFERSLLRDENNDLFGYAIDLTVWYDAP
jgi:hypothetical protein